MPLVAGGGEHRHIRNSIAAGAVVRLLPCSSAGGCNIHCPVAPIMCVGVDGDGLRVDVVAHLAGTLLLAFGGAGGLLNRIPLAVIVETGGRQDILPSQITAGVCRTICCLIATLIVRVTIFPTGSVFMARSERHSRACKHFYHGRFFAVYCPYPCTKSPHRRQWFSSNHHGSFPRRWLQYNRARQHW